MYGAGFGTYFFGPQGQSLRFQGHSLRFYVDEVEKICDMWGAEFGTLDFLIGGHARCRQLKFFRIDCLLKL